MCDSLSHSKDNLSTSWWLFLVSQTKYFAKARRLAGSQLTRQQLDLTNDDDDAQNLYSNKSLILILRDDDENQIIQVETTCELSTFLMTPEILKNMEKTYLRLF